MSATQIPLDLPEPEPNYQFETPADRANRHRLAQVIAQNPELFMLCEGCCNIFKRGGKVEITGMCYVCHGFRFNKDPESVKEQALVMGTRPGNSVLPGDYA